MAAIKHSGFSLPEQILVNLAPAEIKKEGSSFDLPIALAILRASSPLRSDLFEQANFHGELSLNGAVKGVRGAVSLALRALEEGRRAIVLPKCNLHEAALVKGLKIYAVESLAETVHLLTQTDPQGAQIKAPVEDSAHTVKRHISDVRGQALAKRALLIAAAGGHNLLMIGPPGCGKSMLAERFTSLLPNLPEQELLETAKIHSVCGMPLNALLQGKVPFRNPHHLISDAGMVGGGSPPRAGEISMAHNGVLFLDEFPEFRRSVLEALRSPLESRQVTISRVKGSLTLPASFQLIAAMNPCPCGRLGSVSKCICSRSDVQKYMARLSEPILDRIDLHVELEALPFEEMTLKSNGTQSEQEFLCEQVWQARARQLARQKCLNSRLGSERLAQIVELEQGAYQLLEKAAKKIGLSARGFFKVLRTALTLADLEQQDLVRNAHIAEALSFRSLERLKQFCA